jgi:hypothetical protein
MNKTFKRNFLLYVLFDLLIGYAGLFPLTETAAAQFQGPQTLTSTTLAGVVSDTKQTNIQLTTTVNVQCCVNKQSYLYIDGEAMLVVGANGAGANAPVSPFVTVARGVGGTAARTHAIGANVAVGPPNLFLSYDPSGTCTLTPSSGPPPTPPTSTWTAFPFYNIRNGRRWNCINITGQASPLTGYWMVDNGLINLPPGACNAFVSGNAGTIGLTTAPLTSATFAVPVVQTAVTSTGTNTLGISCDMGILTSLIASPPKNIAILNVVLSYGVQSAALAAQANVLASGTFNGGLVFSKAVMPASGAAETASTVAPVRWDAGTLTLTPVVASFNTATTAAGAFYTETFTPASALPITADFTNYYFTANFQASATTATVVNSPGLIVHYAWVPENISVQF